MNVKDFCALIEAKQIVVGANEKREITCGYACDLLSWVLAHGKNGMAWSTVQTHVNVIAVAALMEMSCVILCEGNELEAQALEKATNEGIAVLQTDMTAYEVSGLLWEAGIPAPSEE